MLKVDSMDRIVAFANSVGMTMYWCEDVLSFEVKALFEKYGFATDISIPLDAIKEDEWSDFWTSKVKEANDLLDACQKRAQFLHRP